MQIISASVARRPLGGPLALVAATPGVTGLAAAAARARWNAAARTRAAGERWRCDNGLEEVMMGTGMERG